ncbi:uncharacterized protein LOC114534438 [Dendronephthya gigantea]|uniref:uncharacterized protein LOC114534438 n=1 Tax=Dendronephthya gigantea TaxID=151771 RepID=UPI001068EB09|nr:uncharacterized protein LOC114534438 [Dendronephthya gigantea]
MSDEEASKITNAGEQKLKGDIEKEIAKLKYFLEETNEIIEAKDCDEMEAIYNRAGKIIVKISELVSQTEELKINNGKTNEKQEKAQDEAELRRLELKDKQFQQKEQRRANLKPGEVGYKIAWERLKSEYGHPKHVINAHMDAIINLTPVRGHNYEKMQDFYEKLSNNFDAIQTLGDGEKLSGFVMTTINKLPHIKADLVRADEDWEEWSMDVLLLNLQKWLRRNKVEDASNQKETRCKKPEGHWYQKSSGPPKPHCVFCSNNEYWSDQCKTVKRLADRKKFFAEKNLCFNCSRTGHRGNQCRSRGCLKCKARHHTSPCDKNEDDQENKLVTGFTTLTEEKSLPAIVPVKIKGQTLWAYLDTGSGRDFISREAAKKLNLNPTHHESHEIVTVTGTSTQAMPIFQTTINSLDMKVHEDIELTGSRLQNFTTVKIPDINELKKKYTHMQDKGFYMTSDGQHPIHIILGDGTYSRI